MIKLRYLALALGVKVGLLIMATAYFSGTEKILMWSIVFLSLALGIWLIVALLHAKLWVDRQWPPGTTLYMGPRE